LCAVFVGFMLWWDEEGDLEERRNPEEEYL
jgi:hypothetical protein